MTLSIAQQMKTSLCKHLVDNGSRLSISIDESTTCSVKTALILYIYVETNLSQDPEEIFFELIELNDQKASTIVTAVLTSLERYGMDDVYLKRKLISFASDGASTMIGKAFGVSSLFKEKFPRIVLWHCSNHRIELAVVDTIKETKSINHFQIFIEKLYSTYSRLELFFSQISIKSYLILF